MRRGAGAHGSSRPAGEHGRSRRRWPARPRPSPKRFGEREALRGVSFEARPRRDGGDHRAQRRGQDDAAVDPRRHAGADARDGEPRRRARSAGSRSSRRSTRKLTVAENLRLFARLERVADPDAAVARMLEQTGLRRPRRRRARHAVGRQPPARQHRRRPARRPARAAARRALVVAGPAPARAAVGVRRRAGARAARRSSSPPTTSARPSATPTACSCWPTASCSSRARRAALHEARRRRPRVTSRRRSCASCTSGATERRALAAAQGPADPAPLAVAGGVAGGLPGDHRGADRPGAVARARTSRRSRSSTSCPQRAERASRSAGSDGRRRAEYANELFESIEPVTVRHARGGGRARSRSGEVLGALIVPPDVDDAAAGRDQPRGHGAQPTVEVLYNAEDPVKRAAARVDDQLAPGRRQQGAVATS